MAVNREPEQLFRPGRETERGAFPGSIPIPDRPDCAGGRGRSGRGAGHQLGPGPRFPIALLLAAALGLCAVSCGLEDYPYLYPASGVSASSSTNLDFSHNPENNTSYFLGYEVYYRIYDGTSTSASTVASTDQSYIESSWTSVTPDVILARLKAKGYTRLIHLKADASTVQAAPFARFSSSTSSGYCSFTLDQYGTASIQVDGSTTESFYARRNATNSSTGVYRTFGDFTKDDDCDFTSTGVAAGSKASYAYVMAYVFAYGIDSNTLDTVVSRPSALTSGAIVLTASSSTD